MSDTKEQMSRERKIQLLCNLAAEGFDELVHECKAEEASLLNDSGVADQVEYVVECLGIDAVWKEFLPLIDENDPQVD